MSNKTKRFFNGRNAYCVLSIAVLVALITIGSCALGPKITQISRDPEALREILGSDGIKSYLWFLGIQFLQTVFALIPGEFVEIAAGYIFGSILGLVLCLIGVAVATALIFTLTRLLGKNLTTKSFCTNPRLSDTFPRECFGCHIHILTTSSSGT